MGLSDVEIETGNKRRVPRWLWSALLALVVVVAGVYVAAYFVAGNRVPAQAEVAGVHIGGLSPAQAEEKIRTELAPAYEHPTTLRDAQGREVSIPHAESGFEIDWEGTVADAGGGFSWNPAVIYHNLTGGSAVELRTSVDEDQLRSAIESRADAFATEAVEATLAFEGAEVVRTESVNATRLDVDATHANALEAVAAGESEAEAVLLEDEPAVTSAMVDAAIESFAGPVVSGPVTVNVGDDALEVTPEQIAEATTMSFEGGEFQADIDAEALWELTDEARDDLDLRNRARNATYAMESGSIVVVPSTDGETLAPDALAAAVREAALKTGDQRVAAAEVTREVAEFTTEEAEKVKPREVIGEFTTYYPHAAYRNTNLGRAASSVNGTILMPGDIFSLNDTLGERNASNGYVDGYVINQGILVKESGGGISQSATTLYNAAFFAGYEDIEHRPHSLYFDRYPAGREATIYYGSIDMRFRNDTSYPSYIQGYISPSSPGKRGSITFKIWSIPTYDKVVSTELVKSDFYEGETRTIEDPECEPQSPIKGFRVNWSRLFYKGGDVVKKEDYTWRYSAGDKIECA